MMDRKNAIAITVSVVALVIVLYYLKRQSSSSSTQLPGLENSFTAPYTDWVNGNYPSPDNMNGSPEPFGSIQVNVNIPSISQLSTDYIPVYGFTGVVAVG